MGWLLDRLRAAGAAEQVTALLHRDPAAHAALDDPDAVGWLLDRLRPLSDNGTVVVVKEPR